MNAFIAILALVGGITILELQVVLALWLAGYTEIEIEEIEERNGNE